VREHVESENRQDFAVTMATFSHPRYELVATGETFDGEEQVSAYYRASTTAFPDQRNKVIAVHHGDDVVIVEFDLLLLLRGGPHCLRDCLRPGVLFGYGPTPTGLTRGAAESRAEG
jgi:hypothetical protein